VPQNTGQETVFVTMHERMVFTGLNWNRERHERLIKAREILDVVLWEVRKYIDQKIGFRNTTLGAYCPRLGLYRIIPSALFKHRFLSCGLYNSVSHSDACAGMSPSTIGENVVEQKREILKKFSG
jgi:hypothetical protein